MASENILTKTNLLNPDLKLVKDRVYDPCGISLTNYVISRESVEYGACSFELNGRFIQHRVAKITPTKAGQFVTIWNRSQDGKTEPFDSSDDIDFIIITARKGDSFGQFIFPKALLTEKGIITHNCKDGKRGIRVYPPWDSMASTQAKQTQSWQRKYFLEVGNDELLDLDWVRQLF